MKVLVACEYSGTVRDAFIAKGHDAISCDLLPTLIPTDIVEGREQRIWKMGPSPDRWKERSKTFTGIAAAMADQWSNFDDGRIDISEAHPVQQLRLF